LSRSDTGNRILNITTSQLQVLSFFHADLEYDLQINSFTLLTDSSYSAPNLSFLPLAAVIHACPTNLIPASIKLASFAAHQLSIEGFSFSSPVITITTGTFS
jgi:hypothetical protein